MTAICRKKSLAVVLVFICSVYQIFYWLKGFLCVISLLGPEHRTPKEATMSMTYAGVGVDYNANDFFKRKAQEGASATDLNIGSLGYKVVEWSRGESAFLLEAADHYLAHVEEGLGTKNLVADAMRKLT